MTPLLKVFARLLYLIHRGWIPAHAGFLNDTDDLHLIHPRITQWLSLDEASRLQDEWDHGIYTGATEKLDPDARGNGWRKIFRQ